MKKLSTILAIGFLTVPFAIVHASDQNNELLASDEGKASYAIGLNIGSNLKQQVPDYLNLEALTLGLEDALNEQPLRISEEALTEAIQVMHEEEIAKFAEESQTNLEAGQAYLAENASNPEVTTTDTGLQYKVLTEGNGAIPTANDTVEVKYIGTLIDGTEFDNSENHEGSVEFRVSDVIPGWTEALELMPVGSVWEVAIPTELAYGEVSPSPAIPPNAALVFNIELVDIK